MFLVELQDMLWLCNHTVHPEHFPVTNIATVKMVKSLLLNQKVKTPAATQLA